MARWIVASLHLLALAIGFGSIVARGRALRGTLDAGGLSRVFLADTFWGIAAVLWLATGIPRAFAGLEKGTAYYLGSPLFRLKMGVFLLILALEVWPMVTLIRWRIQLRKGTPIDTTPARAMGRISDLEALLVVTMVFIATALARGLRPW
jgi:putative membrane protein